MRRMYDASTPPVSPPQWECVAGYIGGGTPHIWTDQEWEDQAQKSGAQFRLPIFVRVPPTVHSPTDDANIALGWLIRHRVPKGVCVCLDYETAVNATYISSFDAVITANGYKTLLYGSIAFVTKNPKPSGGYWIADWTGIPHLNAGAAATQWSGSGPFQGAYDPSLVADSTPLWKPGGDVVLTEADKKFIRDIRDTIVGADPFGDRPWTVRKVRSDLDGMPDKIADAVITKLPPGTTSLTAEQLKQAVKDALKEGTGLP